MLCYLLIVLLYTTLADCSDPIITLPNGKIAGRADIVTTNNTKWTIYSYVGIPFATPPIGKLRFQPPQPAKSWQGILECKSNSRKCYQVYFNDQYETEDCLYINVFTKTEPGQERNQPVVVFLYGGAFVNGAASTTHEKVQHFVREDIVVVTFNYRVGSFGFLSTGDTILPGNMGLKDQHLALQWVQNNIHLFGGDRTKVTIMGHSAGGASVSFHLISPMSSGLFRAAVPMSGSALSTFGYQRNAIETAYGIANMLFPNFGRNKTSAELLSALQSVTAKQLDDTASKYRVFAPVVEPHHANAFLDEPFHEASKKRAVNKVPVFIGITSEEAIGHAADLKSLKHGADVYDAHPEALVDSCMNVHEAMQKTVGEKIKKAYTNGLMADDLASVVRYDSDQRYAKPVIRYAQLQSHFVDVYFYMFSYHGEMGHNNASIKGAGRVGHAEDMNYMWIDPYDAAHQGKFPESDLTTAKRYSRLVINFAKELNPTPKKDHLFQNLTVPKVVPNDIRYLNIDQNLQISSHPRDPAYDSWVKLYDQYAQPPFICF